MPVSIVPIITGDMIRPGMKLKGMIDGAKPFLVPTYTGECEKGRHFGKGCYDRIGLWNLLATKGKTS